MLFIDECSDMMMGLNVFDFLPPVSYSLSGCPIAAAVKVSKPQSESPKSRLTPERSPKYDAR